MLKYLFGPVNSRRLGISLGIDLVPFKTCSLNCIFCECGRTTKLTSKIEEYAPLNEILKEIDVRLSTGLQLDVITFSGSGEPTLHSGIGIIIKHIKKNFPGYKTAVLTNGTLLWNESVRYALAEIDIVIPSLHAVTDSVFNRICRPAEGITVKRVIDGLMVFRREFNGEIILEIFIIPGLNNIDSELSKLKEACLRIKPDKIQLNHLDRPGSEDWVQQISRDELAKIKEFFMPLNVEIIGEPGENKQKISNLLSENDEVFNAVVATLKRRPSTLDDLFQSMGIKKVELIKIIEHMLNKGIIREEELERGKFYKLNS